MNIISSLQTKQRCKRNLSQLSPTLLIFQNVVPQLNPTLVIFRNVVPLSQDSLVGPVGIRGIVYQVCHKFSALISAQISLLGCRGRAKESRISRPTSRRSDCLHAHNGLRANKRLKHVCYYECYLLDVVVVSKELCYFTSK